MCCYTSEGRNRVTYLPCENKCLIRLIFFSCVQIVYVRLGMCATAYVSIVDLNRFEFRHLGE